MTDEQRGAQKQANADEAADALESLLLMLRFDRGLPTEDIINGFHAQVVTMMVMLMGGIDAEKIMIEAGAKVRPMPSIARMRGDTIGRTIGRA